MQTFTVCVYVCLFVFLFSDGNAEIIVRHRRDVLGLLKKYNFNKFLLANAPKPFHIVFPKQIRKRQLDRISTKERQISHHGTFEHYQTVTLQIVLDKKKHKIKLDRNDGLLSAGIKVKHYQGEQKEVITQTVEHCYYHGTVKRDDWSAAAMSTCDGIRGVIQVNNETYIIHPLTGGDEGMEHPHIVFKATSSKEETCGNDHGKWLPFHELHKGEFIRKLKFLNAQRMTREVKDVTADKFLKLALVLDNSMYWSLNLTKSQMLEYAIQTANIVDMYYKEINIRIAVTYVELWNHDNQIHVTPRLRETLENFMKFQQDRLQDVDHHAAHLLTRTAFEDNSVGMAIPDSICTRRAAGIDRSTSYLEPQQGATVLSHMIGHNLGIKHDEDGGCQCEDEFGCIMSTEVLATPEKHSRMFSTCSVSDWGTSLNMGIAACLTHNPQPTFPQVCGNQHLERGEECDCGSPEECALTDPCCDPDTCLLKYWAQCRMGPCCHNCTYLSSNYMCRPQSTDCDVPEFCTGTDGQCPPNNYAKDGHHCNNSTGYCIGGICPTLNKQCQKIWGGDATRADSECFERFNPTGNFNGHCGKDTKTGSFAKCLPDNVQCGLLHCAGGNKVPFYGPDRDSSKTTVFSNGKEYECKIVHGPSTLGLPHMGLVQDGTKCGQDLVCRGSQCVPITDLPPLACPGTANRVICSNHGMCTKDDSCFCYDGWGSPDCSVKLNTTRVILSIDSLTRTTVAPPVQGRGQGGGTTPVEQVRAVPLADTDPTDISVVTDHTSSAVVHAENVGLVKTEWMMIILAAVIGGLAVILAFAFLCYRRRSPVKFGSVRTKKKKNKKMFGGSSSDLEEQRGNKLIKFGSLPSYKNDKKAMKKKGKFKKGRRSEDDSDIGELPPPPTIISDPNGAKPEKGILKSPFTAVKYMNAVDRCSSESITGTSDGNCDQDSVGPYDEIDDDTEAGEIQDILGGYEDPEKSLDALDNLVESSSFDFVLPRPFGNAGMHNRSPSPPWKFNGYDLPLTSVAQRPNLWRNNLPSPPKSRVLRMSDLLNQIDRHTIDLSPSPDDPPVQISPSISEDVRSTSTEDRQYPASSHDTQSPMSFTSGSTCTALRPLLGSQWSKYLLHQNGDSGNVFNFDDIESPLPHINIPPPMNPINIRSIFNYGQKGVNRDNNDTPLGSQNGELSSNNGTANSRNGCEKSSGYGSEHDAEHLSIDGMSQNQSRAGSTSPPNFSAVIRTGPNQIKLVPATIPTQTGTHSTEDDWHKLLDGMPRINAGCYERSPLSKLPQNNAPSVTTSTSTLETVKSSIPEYASSELFNSTTNTLINSDPDINMLDRSIEVCDNENQNNKQPTAETPEMLKKTMPQIANGPIPNPKPLSEVAREHTDSAPCIDRSLEEIPQFNNQRNSKYNSASACQRPVSISVFKKQSSLEKAQAEDALMGQRHSAIDQVPYEICEC